MSALYRMLGTSRQAEHQQRQRDSQRHAAAEEVLRLIRAYREEHPRLGLRKIFEKSAAEAPVGRDAFISIGMLHGMGAVRPTNKRRTTFGNGERRYPNLLIGRTLNDVNQAWVSDLTYYPVGRRFGYLTLIMDLYSRRIVAHAVAPTMHAHWTIEAFQKALSSRAIGAEHQLIVHSDQGGQYISHQTEVLMASYGALISTSEIVYENSHAERLNGIIKGEYLDAWSIPTLEVLARSTAVAVERYNTSRPHGSLALLAPIEFEARLQQQPLAEHPGMAVWPAQPLRKLSLNVDVPYKL
jgi:putative transposase